MRALTAPSPARRSSRRVLMFFAATLGFASLAVVTLAQEPVTVEIVAARDATLVERPQGNKANGAGRHFFVGKNANSGRRRALVEFDVASALPEGAMLENAVLRLRLSRTNVGWRDVAIHRCLASWTEGPSRPTSGEGAGADSLEGDVTWKHRSYPNLLWNAPGGDFAIDPTHVQRVKNTSFYEFASDSLTAEVRAWAEGSVENYGWMLLGDEDYDGVSSKRFDSHENLTSGNRPVLILTYLPPPAAEPCMTGTVDLGRGAATDVLFVNGTAGDAERRVTLSIGDPITLTMAMPPAGPTEARFALYLEAGAPALDASFPQPAGIGPMCFASPLDGSTPHKIWNNIGHQDRLGKPDFPSTPAPCTILDAPDGSDRAAIVTLQALILDSGSAGDVAASVTNAVTIAVD